MLKETFFKYPQGRFRIVVSQTIRKMIFVRIFSQQLRNVGMAYQSYLIMNNNKKYRNRRRKKLKLRYVRKDQKGSCVENIKTNF